MAAVRKRVDEVLLERGAFAVLDDTSQVLVISAPAKAPLAELPVMGIGELHVLLSMITKLPVENNEPIWLWVDDGFLKLQSKGVKYAFKLTEPEFIATRLADPEDVRKEQMEGAVTAQVETFAPLLSALSVLSSDAVTFSGKDGQLIARASGGVEHNAEVALGEVDGDVECTVDGEPLADALSVVSGPVELKLKEKSLVILSDGYHIAVSAAVDVAEAEKEPEKESEEIPF